MVLKKRIRRTAPDDRKRLYESFTNNYGNSIKDRESFNNAWDDYWEGSEQTKFVKESKPIIWEEIKRSKGLEESRNFVTIKGKVYYTDIRNGKRIYYREHQEKRKGQIVTRYRNERGYYIKV